MKKIIRFGMELFGQYKGLRKELYVLFWGRVATNMGAMIWPMMTLILSNKMGMNAVEIATITIQLGVLQFVANLIGGKAADKWNKRNLILVCDLVTVACYLGAGFLPVSMYQIFLLFMASLFQTIENPAYDALIADLSSAKDRNRAYSLMYLGMNLGFVLAPTIGGMLFQKYLNVAFFIDGLTTLSSAVFIFLFIKNITPDAESQQTIYEQRKDEMSVWRVLAKQKLLLLFFLCWGFYVFLYEQFSFLIPLNLESIYEGNGAVYFGLLTSLNGLVVILGTPFLSRLCEKWTDLRKLLFGEFFVWIGLVMWIFIQEKEVFYFLSIIIFTLGEILTTLGAYPYLTRRIPASHRGRVSSVVNVFLGGASYLSKWYVGWILTENSIRAAWCFVCGIGGIGICAYFVLLYLDQKEYPLFYLKEK